MDLWNRMMHRAPDPAPPPPAELARDPDLDAVHREQHELIDQTGYARERIRDSWNERVKDSWRPIPRGS